MAFDIRLYQSFNTTYTLTYIHLDFYLPANFNPTSIPSPRVYFKSLRLHTQKYNHFISNIYCLINKSYPFSLYYNPVSQSLTNIHARLVTFQQLSTILPLKEHQRLKVFKTVLEFCLLKNYVKS